MTRTRILLFLALSCCVVGYGLRNMNLGNTPSNAFTSIEFKDSLLGEYELSTTMRRLFLEKLNAATWLPGEGERPMGVPDWTIECRNSKSQSLAIDVYGEKIFHDSVSNRYFVFDDWNQFSLRLSKKKSQGSNLGFGF